MDKGFVYKGLPIIFLVLALGCFITRNSFTGLSFFMRILSAGLVFLAALCFTFAPFSSQAARVMFAVRFAMLSLAAVFIISFAAVQWLIISGNGGTENPDADVLIVLGAGIYGETPSLSLSSRLDAALEYLEQNESAVAVLAGGQGPGETITEALAMKRYLAARGIDEKRLYMEDKSTSTEENIAFSVDIMREKGIKDKKVLVVSNDFHLYRAAKIAEKNGLEAQTLSAPTPKINIYPLACYVREYFAICAGFVSGIFGG